MYSIMCVFLWLVFPFSFLQRFYGWVLFTKHVCISNKVDLDVIVLKDSSLADVEVGLEMIVWKMLAGV